MKKYKYYKTITCGKCNESYIINISNMARSMKRWGCWICKSCAMRMVRASMVGAKFKKAEGYIREKTLDGWRYEHILKMERYLERKLEKGEVVHHCDRTRDNNELYNLELMLRGAHSSLHGTVKSGEKCINGRIKK